MRQVLLNLPVLLILLFSLSNAATFQGWVVDRDGTAIEGVNIQTGIFSLYTVSNQSGEFVLETGDLIPSYMTFSHISFQPQMISVSDENSIALKIILEPAVYPGQKIRVTSMRARRGVTPIAFADFSEDDIERDYTLGDMPVLLETTPNMYAISYTGGITGASDYKIRGFGYKQIGVYINGVPLNDPEDRFTYFYDLPDFAAEVTDIQVQRGVGNSLYGEATFGGSINIASDGLNRNRKISVTSGYGKFSADGHFVSEMRKQSVEYSSGLIDGRWSLAGRYSKMYSGGYRENAWYDGWAYFLSLSRLDNSMATTVNIYGGPMKAALAFSGITRDTMKFTRRYNPSTYENEIDDFNQPHYEIHNSYRINENVMLKNSLYYIRGKGYYEQYKKNRDIGEYNIAVTDLVDPGITEIDLVRQKWVTKNQYGWNPRLDINHNKGNLSVGGAFYYFNSIHWGQVVWGENLSADGLAPRHKYYNYKGTKYSASLYALDYYSLTDKLQLMGNLQIRYLKYDFAQDKIGLLPGYQYDIDWLFLSPRVGLTYKINSKSNLYFSFAVASREPADVSIYDAEEVTAFPNLEVKEINVSVVDDTTYTFGQPTIDPERVYNFELGSNFHGEKYRAGLSLFWMEFKNEIIAEGAVDQNGHQQVGNAKRSVHAGIEFDGSYKLTNKFSISANSSYNFNRLKRYSVFPDYDWDGVVDDTLDYSDNVLGGFPEYLTNLILDYKTNRLRLTFRLRGVGKQYLDNAETETLAIEPYAVSSLSGALYFGGLDGAGRFVLSVRVDNLFDKKYETSGYAYWWGPDPVGEYYVGAERSFFVQLKWELE